MNTAAVAAGGVALVWLLTRRRKRPPPAGAAVVVEPTPPSSEAYDPLIVALFEEFVRPEPTAGYFYQVEPDDDLMTVVKRALDTVGPNTQAARLTYAYCLQSGPKHNMRLYGTPSTNKDDFPGEYLVPGKNLGVRVAFRPRNDDAMVAILSGKKPRMTVDKNSGAPLPPPAGGNSLGLLWLPPTDPQSLALGDPTCAPYPWSDGSSSIDPPPELLNMLEA